VTGTIGDDDGKNLIDGDLRAMCAHLSAGVKYSPSTIVDFPQNEGLLRFHGDFRLDTHPPTHLTIGYQMPPVA
jgi:hypothetical protein